MSVIQTRMNYWYRTETFSLPKAAPLAISMMLPQARGQDTVNISAAAQALAQGEQASFNVPLENSSKAGLKKMQWQGEKPLQPVSLREQGVSLIKMLLENVFLADLEKNDAQVAASEGSEDTLQQSQSLLADSDKVKDMKQFVTDVMTGKADIKDMTQHMGAMSQSSRFVGKGSATASQDTKNDKKSTEIAV